MPIYEYSCKKCGAVSEHLVSSSGGDQLACRKCGSSEIERIQFSRFSVGGSAPEKPCGFDNDCGSCCAGGMCGLHGKQ